jgi:hypothetical protein
MVIILWPVSPSPYDPMPVQSIYAIKHLPWFIILFATWTLVIAAILFLVRGGIYERLALCLVFSLVFVNFWTFVSPWGTHSDSTWLTGHVQYLLDTGQLPPGGHLTLRYFDYPALSLLGVAMVETTGMSVFITVQVFLLMNGFLFVLILYAAFLKFLKTPQQAAVSVILALCSSMVLALVPDYFHPIGMATTFIAMFLLLLAMTADGKNRYPAYYVLIILLVIAATTEYLFTPVLFMMVILGSYLLDRILGIRGFATFNIFALILVVFFSWLVYMTVSTMANLVAGLPKIIADFQNETWLLYIIQELRTQGGTTYPWWGTISRFFWWFFVLGFGTFIVLGRVFSLRKADGLRRLEIAWFLGLAATVIIGSFLTTGVVHGGLSRYIWIAPFFAVPAIIEVLRRPAARIFAVALALVGITMVVPTFLSNADTVSRDTTYQHELAAGQFIASIYGRGEGLVYYSIGPGLVFPMLYTPDAQVRTMPEGRGIDEDSVWRTMRTLLRNFFGIYDQSDQAWMPIPGYHTILISSWKMRTQFQEKVGIPPDHSNWDEVERELASATKIYDNHYLQMYVPPLEQHIVSFFNEDGAEKAGGR